MEKFEQINKGFNKVFKAGELTLGIVTPIEHYVQSPVPTMKDHLAKVKLVEELGFKAIWVRDVPLNVPAFGDAGQTFDPFTYLGFIAAHTSKIALATGSIALPLHHPIHVAKSAATVDQLSDGRLILGVASGDRPSEYPAMGIDFEKRGELFRKAFNYIRNAQANFPIFENESYGNLDGQTDILPKAYGHKIPMLVTGNSRQSVEWIAENADGWMYYPRNAYMQEHNISEWRKFNSKTDFPLKPFMQPLHIELVDNDTLMPQPIHLGFRSGIKFLLQYLHERKQLGVNHIGINLRFNTANIEQTLERLAKEVLPHFH